MKDREKARLARKRYRQRHPDSRKKERKRYRQNHPDKIAELKRRYDKKVQKALKWQCTVCNTKFVNGMVARIHQYLLTGHTYRRMTIKEIREANPHLFNTPAKTAVLA